MRNGSRLCLNGALLQKVSREWKGWVKADQFHRELTHTLFTGGRFSIADEFDTEFLRVYAEDIERGVPHFVNELRSPVFKLFYDIDLITESELTDDDCVHIASIVQACVKEFYPRTGELPVCVICRAPCKVTEKGVKNGVHVHFPYLKVVREEAMLMRCLLLDRIERCRVCPLNPDGWRDAIDEQVYINSGLRLLGSCKLSPCPHCAKAGCEECIEKGMVMERRPYGVTSVLDGNGEADDALTEMLRSNVTKAVFCCSIRTRGEKTDGWVRMEGCPSFYDVQESNHKNHLKKEYHAGKEHRQDRDATSTWKRKTDRVTDPEKIAVVEYLIQKRMKVAFYANLKVQTLQFCATGKTPVFWARVRQTYGSSYCLNKMADHSRNTIFSR